MPFLGGGLRGPKGDKGDTGASGTTTIAQVDDLMTRSFYRDFATLKNLNDHGTGPNITFTRGSNATYFDADGDLQTASNDVPRFDHDPSDGASLGLLIEEARTNSIRNSQAGGSTNGVIGSGGVLPTNWSAASTAAAAYEVIGTGTEAGFSYIDIKISGTNSTGTAANPAIGFEGGLQIVASQNQAWTSSLYVSLVSGSTSGVASFEVNIVERDSTGAVLANSGTAFTPTATRSRFSHTRTMASAVTGRVTDRIRLTVNDGQTYDLTLRIAAPQLEQGAFPTSYIPTTTAAATRSADSAVVTPISSFYNQAEGTLFAEFIDFGNVSATFMSIMEFNDNSFANRFLFGVREGAGRHARMDAVNTGAGGINRVISYSGADGVIAENTIAKMSAGYAPANYAVSANGLSVVTSTDNATMPSGMTHLLIGKNLSTQYQNAFLRKVAYYPKRLTNTLLEQLTT